MPSGGSLGCSIGSRVSRVRFPSVSDQATAAATLHHNTYRVHPRPIGGSLQCRWRARGGGAPCVEPLSRRWTPVARRSERATGELAFTFVHAETTAGLAGDGRVEQARVFCGGVRRRQRASVKDPRSSGCVPVRWNSSGIFSSPIRVGVFCGSLQCLLAMEMGDELPAETVAESWELLLGPGTVC